MPFASLADVLRRVAAEDPEREAYRHDGKRATYGWLDRAADGFASTLLDLAVARGATVCLLLPSSIKLAACYFGAARVGAVTCAVDLDATRAAQEAILARSDPAVTVVGDGSQIADAAIPGHVLPVTELKDAFARSAPAVAPVVDRDDGACMVWTPHGNEPGRCTRYTHAALQAADDARSRSTTTPVEDQIRLSVPCADPEYMVGVYAFTRQRVTIELPSTSEPGGQPGGPPGGQPGGPPGGPPGGQPGGQG